MMNKKSLKTLKNDKRAVSPVIGVILMVAITVILAAVIAAFVFGIGPPSAKINPAYALNRIDENNVRITLHDLGGAGNVTDHIAYVSGLGAPMDGGLELDGEVGESANIDTSADSGWNKPLVVTAKVDGDRRVIVDTTI